MADIMGEIEARLDGALQRLAAGDDLPPATQLRIEGLCEAAVLTGEADVAEIDALIEARMRARRGVGPRELLGDDWRAAHPFPELPLYMDRAPVSPSGGR